MLNISDIFPPIFSLIWLWRALPVILISRHALHLKGVQRCQVFSALKHRALVTCLEPADKEQLRLDFQTLYFLSICSTCQTNFKFTLHRLASNSGSSHLSRTFYTLFPEPQSDAHYTIGVHQPSRRTPWRVSVPSVHFTVPSSLPLEPSHSLPQDVQCQCICCTIVHLCSNK